MTQDYIGTKQVQAWEQQKESADGYGVKYQDGYISWSPKDVFESAYLALGHVGDKPPHVQRMIGEKAQLDDRLAKLQKFIASPAFQEQSSKSRELLTTQAGAMAEYSELLQVRLDLA